MILVTNVFLEIFSEVLVSQIQIEKEKWKAVKGFCKISVICDCVCQSEEIVKESKFNYNRTFQCVKASMSSSAWTKVCVIILISLSCCLPEQLENNVFKCMFSQ